jgi:transglutaminase-like putative cysteine protease
MRAFVALVCGLCALMWARLSSAAPDFDVKPVPAWVDRDVPDLSTSLPAAGARGGLVNALVDDQINVGRAVEHYVRRVRRVVSAAGVENAGQIELEFDPTYERLVLHGIHVWRNGRAFDALDRKAVRLLERETDADERIYDGVVTALTILKDVRVGDAVDYEYSVVGANPVFRGRFVRTVSLANALSTERLRVRLLAAAGRPIALSVRGAEAKASVRDLPGGIVETTWDLRNVAAVEHEGNAPAWFDPVPSVGMSEFRDWSEVAAWAASTFEVDAHLGPALAAEVESIRGRYGDEADRALAALELVQDEVRYLGIESGEHSQVPHAPEAVLEQRFGDCKDKSVLLVTLLRALGIESQPALVNAGLGEKVADHLPSPTAFNHVIVRARVLGKTYFVDPTWSSQGGTFAARASLGYGRALVVAPGTKALETIERPTPDAPSMLARAVFHPTPGGGASFDADTTYRGDEADSMRSRLARTPLAELSNQYLNFYAAREPHIAVQKELSVEDDRTTDVLVVHEHYAIPDYWSDGVARALAESVDLELHEPKVKLRASPLSVAYPSFVRQEVEIEFPHAPTVVPESQSLADDALSFVSASHVHGSTLTLSFELHAKRDFVPPSEVAAHLALVESIRDAVDIAIADRGEDTDTTESKRVGHVLAQIGIGFGGLLGVVMIVVGVKEGSLWMRRRRFRRAVRVQAGDTATQPIRVRDRVQATESLRARPCICGGDLCGVLSENDWGVVRLGDRMIDVARPRCGSCRTTRPRYFDIASP